MAWVDGQSPACFAPPAEGSSPHATGITLLLLLWLLLQHGCGDDGGSASMLDAGLRDSGADTGTAQEPALPARDASASDSATPPPATRDGGGVDARAADDDDAGEADRLASKIEFSCVQTIACTPPPGNAAPSGAVSRCIESTTEVLAAQPELLDAYLQAFAECDAFVACDYVECSNRRQ